MPVKYWFVTPWVGKGARVSGDNITSEDAVKLLGIDLHSAWAAIELTKEEYDRNQAKG